MSEQQPEQPNPRTRAPTPPKKGPGQYGDGFTIQRVEGGFFVVIESSEQVEQPQGEGPVAQLIPAAAREQFTRVTHQRRVVAKSLSELVALLRDWTEGSTT